MKVIERAIILVIGLVGTWLGLTATFWLLWDVLPRTVHHNVFIFSGSLLMCFVAMASAVLSITTTIYALTEGWKG